jgi:RHS repeat-associated protein
MVKNSQSYFYHFDGLGSVTGITDTNGTVVQRYDYDSFGNIISMLDPNFIQPYTYAGREYEPETGLYYYRARYYDSRIGRFISEDTIRLLSGDINYFSYVGNNPVNFVDPLGLFTWKGWAGVIVGGVGVAMRNPALIIAGGILTVWDWYDSIQKANKKGEELAEQYEKLKKPEQDRIKKLIGEEHPPNKPKRCPQEESKNGK